MAEFSKLTKVEGSYFVDDGANRGPLTMIRVRFHPSSALLFGQCVDRRLALWDLPGEPQDVKKQKEKQVVGELVCAHEMGWIRGFDIHPRGDLLATGGSDRTLRLWRCENGRPAEAPHAAVPAHHGWVDAVAYSPDGGHIATAGADNLVKIWNADDLQPIKTLEGHAKFVCDVIYSGDGKLLASGGEDGRVIVRDAESFDVLRTIACGTANKQYGQNPGHSGVHRLSISHDQRWLAVAGGEKVELYDLASGEIVASERTQMDVAFHPAAAIIVVGENEPKVWAYDAAKFAPPEKDKDGRAKSPAALAGPLLGSIKRGDWSLGIDFSPDGKHLAFGRGDGKVELWELS